MEKIKRRYITLITNISLVLIFLFVLGVSFFPSDSVSTYGGKKEKAIYLGNQQNKNVSIMINVYENALIVNQMIDVFLDKNVKATFFVGGCWADDNSETLNRLKDNGFEIGNHGYYHKDHNKLSKENNIKEIENCNKMVYSLCGINTYLFAPPSGSYNDNTMIASSLLNHKVIMWSKDTIDWRDSDENVLFKRATKNAQNGDFILMHPKKHTLRILPSIIDYYLSCGFNIVTVGENIEGI